MSNPSSDAPPSSQAAPRTRRILVVDDDEAQAELVASFLSGHGYELRTANDGPEALAVVREFEPDLILLDIGLPGPSGYDVAQELCEDASIPSCRLVAVTGFGDPEHLWQSASFCFEEHLVKPVSLQQLLAVVRAG